MLSKLRKFYLDTLSDRPQTIDPALEVVLRENERGAGSSAVEGCGPARNRFHVLRKCRAERGTMARRASEHSRMKTFPEPRSFLTEW